MCTRGVEVNCWGSLYCCVLETTCIQLLLLSPLDRRSPFCILLLAVIWLTAQKGSSCSHLYSCILLVDRNWLISCLCEAEAGKHWTIIATPVSAFMPKKDVKTTTAVFDCRSRYWYSRFISWLLRNKGQLLLLLNITEDVINGCIFKIMQNMALY